MRLIATTILFFSLMTWTDTATAQTPIPVSIAPLTAPAPQGEVDILVEGDTYTPSFYRGRAEPSPGNIMTLVAIPVGIDGSAANISYRWSINGRSFAETDQRINITAPLGTNFTIQVTVLQNETVWAQKSESIRGTEPQLVFYEDNILRGIGSTAITDSFYLIGNEASVSAEPFFVGKTSIPQIQGIWRVDGQAAKVEDWRKLSFTKPEEPEDRYRVSLELINQNNFAEAIQNSFYLYLGI